MAENLGYHRKYRPNTIASCVGLDKIKTTILKALETGKRPQTIMLYGDSGCGKTTMARIIAKEYNCQDRTEHGACGFCPVCVAMDEYIETGVSDLLGNIKEVDVGDNSGKRDLESVFSDIEIPPMGDEWKVYIFDEIQSASDGLQNRMLKVMEEPPEHVLFILCTTNPERILPTLKNRCQLKLHVTKPNMKDLTSLLRRVCEIEEVEYDKAGLEFIANRSEFVIRDSLQSLWQVVMEQNNAKYESVTKVFTAVSSTQVIQFFRTLKNRDIFGFVNCISEVKQKFELNVFLRELQAFLTRGIYIINGIHVEGVASSELKVYKDLFSEMSVSELGYLMSKLLNIDTRNTELELLVLGFRGLNEGVSEAKQPESIPELENELALESQNANNVIAKKQHEEYEQGIENAENLMGEIDFNDLLSLGAQLVKE